MAFGSESEDSETKTSVLPVTPFFDFHGQPISEKKKFHCNVEGCSASFSRPWKLSAHNYVHTGEKGFTCGYEGCDKSFTSHAHLRRHKTTAHCSEENTNKETYKCKFPGCNVELKSRLLEKRHFKRTHVHQSYNCSECDQGFKKRSQLKEHFYTHSAVATFFCEKCEKNFIQPQEYKRHLRGHKIYVCEEQGCDISFNTWTLFRKHRSAVHKPEFVCDYCSKRFKRKPDLRHHILRHVARLESGKQAALKEPIKRVHVCDFEGCGAKFLRPYRLAAHISYVHMGQKSFVCDHYGCNKSYTRDYHLRRHKITVHLSYEESNEETFKCQFPGCEFVMKNKYNLDRHFKRFHVKKEFACSECNESFKKHSQLRVHMYLHTGEPPLSCKTCGLGFITASGLKKHTRSHRIHICQVLGCIETFPTWSLLRKHCATSHKREFSCHYCSKTYKRKIELKYHVVRHIEFMTGKKARDRKKNYLKIHICDICQTELKGKHSLKRHIVMVHERTAEEKEAMKKKAEERKAKGRAKRKDAGVPKKSLAGVLAEVDPLIPPEVHTRLIAKEKLIADPEDDEREAGLIILNHLQC